MRQAPASRTIRMLALAALCFGLSMGDARAGKRVVKPIRITDAMVRKCSVYLPDMADAGLRKWCEEKISPRTP